jgi:hypothetical protein
MRLQAFLLLSFCLVLILPASALLTPNTVGGAAPATYNTSSFTHDVNYLPTEFVYAFIVLGFFTMIASQAIIRYGILYAILSPIAFGMAAWYSNYMTQETVNAIYSCALDTTVMLHTEIITPIPAMTVFLVVCFIVSFINLAVIYFLSRSPVEKDKPDQERSDRDD